MSDEKLSVNQVVSEIKPRRPRRNRKTDWLGERLRALYDTYGQAPIPAEMQKILDQLSEDEPEKPSGEGSR